MSEQHTILSSADYKVELAKTLTQWVPHDRLISDDAPSGMVAIRVTNVQPLYLHFTVRDPEGSTVDWTVSWQTLLAFGGMKQSQN